MKWEKIRMDGNIATLFFTTRLILQNVRACTYSYTPNHNDTKYNEQFTQDCLHIIKRKDS